IVSGNSSGVSGTPDISAVLNPAVTVNADHSAIGSASGFSLSATSFFNLPFGANLQLQPLAFNGGPTQTQLLASTSPAIDHGSNPAGLTTDQRGGTFSRASGLPDIGAAESGN